MFCFPFFIPIPLIIPYRRRRSASYFQNIPSGTVVCPQPLVMVPAPSPYYSVVPNAMPYYAPTYAVAQPGYGVQPGIQQPNTQPVEITDDDIKQVHEMFPNMEREVIKTLLESNRGNKDSTVTALLSMSSDS